MSLQQIHMFKVSQHAKCVIRVTVVDEKGEVKSDGHKVRRAGSAALRLLQSGRRGGGPAAGCRFGFTSGGVEHPVPS